MRNSLRTLVRSAKVGTLTRRGLFRMSLVGAAVLSTSRPGMVSIGAAPAAAAAATASSAGTLTVALSSFLAEDVVPSMITGFTQVYSGYLYDYLVGVGDDGTLSRTTGVAQDWSVSPTGDQWTFTIRQGIKFHNGDPLTAEDVQFSLQQVLDPKATSSSAPHLREIVKSVDVDGRQVIVRLSRPEVTLHYTLSIIGGSEGAVIPKRYYESVGIAGFRARPVGSGPWVFENRQVGQSIQYRANHAYWRSGAAFETLQLNLVSEPSTRLAQLEAGEVDIAEILRSDVRRLTASGRGLRSVVVPNTGSAGIHLAAVGQSGMVYNDRRVREALAIAVDRNAIVATVMSGAVTPAATYVVNPSMQGYDPTLKPYAFDPVKAKQLLADAGYANGFPMKFYVVSLPGLPEGADLAQAVAGYWQAIGVKTEIIPIDFVAFRGKFSANPQGFAPPAESYLFVAPTRPESLSLLRIYYASQQGGGVMLIGGSDATKIDGMLDDASKQTDDARRAQIIRTIVRMTYDDFLAVPLFYYGDDYVVGKRVASWKPVPGSAQALRLETATPVR